MARQAYKTLSTGKRMPAIGFGTYMLHGEAATEAVDCALSVGYRHIDTAATYGNETAVGDAIKPWMKDGRLKRRDLFVTTKISVGTLSSATKMKQGMERSLEELQLTHADLLLLHGPWACTLLPDGTRVPTSSDIHENWDVMEGFFKDGRALNIGLSNFSVRLIDRIIKGSRIKPHNLQLECHAYLQQNSLRAFCQEHDIVVTGYSPLGAPERALTQNNPILLNDPAVKRIAEVTGRTPGQVLLQYVRQLGVVPLPMADCRQHIEENFQAVNDELAAQHCDVLKTLDRGVKYYPMEWGQKHAEYQHGEEF